MDPSWIATIPEPLRSLLIGAAGDFSGGLAASAVVSLVSQTSYQVRKRLQPEPQQAALNQAMAEALLLTVRELTDDLPAQQHYLTLLSEWLSREAVKGELSQIIDPRPDAEIDLELLAEEFRAAGYEPDLLGEVDFRATVARLISHFYTAAAGKSELQGQIEIGLLRGIAEQNASQVKALHRITHLLEQHLAPDKHVSESDAVTLNNYLGWVRRNYDKAQVFGLESPKNTKQPKRELLTDVFIPLRLRRFNPPSRQELQAVLRGKTGVERAVAWRELVQAQGRAGEVIVLENLLMTSDRLAIIGGAGCGKSTVLHYLAATMAQKMQEKTSLKYRLPGNNPLIPFLIPLRYYRDYLAACQEAKARTLDTPTTGTMSGFITWYLQRSSKCGSEQFFHSLLKKGGCLLMIDGLDEVVTRQQRGQVREQVETLIRAEYPLNRIIVTAREAGFQEEAVFSDDFTRLDVQDLSPEEIQHLVGNWCVRLYPEDVSGNQRKLVEAIAEVNERRLEKALTPLISTPLMVTMVVSVQWGETELPRERAALYEACVKAILQAQYTPEESRREVTDWGGPWEAQRDWLCNLALQMHAGGRSGAALREEQIRETLGKNLPNEKLDAFIEAARYRGGLFEERGEFFEFSHLTFQEFLAARLLARRREAGRPDLQPHIAESWWREVALLTYGYLSMDSGELFMGNDSPAAQHLHWLSHLPDSDTLRLAGAELAGASVLEIEKPDPKLRLQQANVLVALLQDKQLTVAGPLRAQAGRTLARLGDPRPGVGLRADGVPDIAWCPVEDGDFLLGNTRETDPEADNNEMPQCPVTLPAFAISRYPITNAQYGAFVAAGGYTAPHWQACWTDAGLRWKRDRTGPETYGGVYDLPNHPVAGVSWYEAWAFARWLAVTRGEAISLPTEAQWERTARHTDSRRYPWRRTASSQDLTPDHANYEATGIGMTTAVGIFPRGAAECGALDLSGNVWEWCRTQWRDTYATPANDDPAGGARRVLRGGSFLTNSWTVRGAVRFRNYPNPRYGVFGFRVILSSP